MVFDFSNGRVGIVVLPNGRGQASDLFYAEGVHTVGVDWIVAHAGVAKATLYTLFGSKDGLSRRTSPSATRNSEGA
jgi:hypothetical protein